MAVLYTSHNFVMLRLGNDIIVNTPKIQGYWDSEILGLGDGSSAQLVH